MTSNWTRHLGSKPWVRIVVGTWNHTTTATANTTTLMSSQPSTPRMMRMSTLTAAEQQFVKEGIMDERGLVQFDTLHNMQVRSCRAYADKDLFATYSPTTQNFEWMTFAECK